MQDRPHLPVMLEQAIELLQVKPGGIYVDLTLGASGHARRILEHSAPDGHLVALDRDPQAIERARSELADYADRVHLAHLPFSRLPEALAQAGITRVDGVLADLGVSSMQLDQAERGFSFRRSGPLDMRMDPSRGVSLAEVLDDLDERSLATSLRRLGEVKSARSIARRILKAHAAGQLACTTDLADAVGGADRRGRVHPATRVFMALRMLVNRELDELAAVLDNLPEPLATGGRVVFISFHSLEDRAVKSRFVALEGHCICPPGLPVCGCGRQVIMSRISKRAIRASESEIQSNPRSRSARLRVAERVAA